MEPASCNSLMEMGDVCDNIVTICDLLIVGGRARTLIFHVWVDDILSPSCRFNMSGWVAFLMFFTSGNGNTNFYVDSESPIPPVIYMLMLFFVFSVSNG